MAKASKTKEFAKLKDPKGYFVDGRGDTGPRTADAAQVSLTNNQGVIVRQQRVWDREARLSGSVA